MEPPSPGFLPPAPPNPPPADALRGPPVSGSANKQARFRTSDAGGVDSIVLVRQLGPSNDRKVELGRAAARPLTSPLGSVPSKDSPPTQQSSPPPSPPAPPTKAKHKSTTRKRNSMEEHSDLLARADHLLTGKQDANFPVADALNMPPPATGALPPATKSKQDDGNKAAKDTKGPKTDPGDGRNAKGTKGSIAEPAHSSTQDEPKQESKMPRRLRGYRPETHLAADDEQERPRPIIVCQCGAEMPLTGKFCGRCGIKFQLKRQQQADDQGKDKNSDTGKDETTDKGEGKADDKGTDPDDKERWSLRQRRLHRLHNKVERIQQKAEKRQARAEDTVFEHFALVVQLELASQALPSLGESDSKRPMTKSMRQLAWRVSRKLEARNDYASLGWHKHRPAAATSEKDELPNGLTDAEAKQCQKGYELHEVPEIMEPLWKVFVKQFVGPMHMVIGLAALLSMSKQNWSYVTFLIVSLFISFTRVFLRRRTRRLPWRRPMQGSIGNGS